MHTDRQARQDRHQRGVMNTLDYYIQAQTQTQTRAPCSRYVTNAHHVEVQIFGDGAGRCVHFGERECSIQRRHQKVLEETPSPLLRGDSGEEIRQALTAAAVALGRSIKYRSAGGLTGDEEAR